MADIEINWRDIDKALEKGFKDSVYAYGAEITKVISRPRFWDGFGDVRDIVDLGQLRASQVIEFNSPLEATISYTAEHADWIHNGTTRVVFGGRIVRVAPRPFLRIAAEEMNLNRVMEKNIKYRLERI